jgi:glutathione peroxidase
MKIINTILFLIAFNFAGKSQQLANFHDFTGVTIQGDSISFSQYAGKKLLVVNTASFCAYTYQYEDLQGLYNIYGGDQFEILGFPCNNFGSQEPGSDSTIIDFCTGNYGVTFQMMSRIDIKTGDTAEVYKWLQRGDLNGVEDVQVSWNFHKFLIDPDGNYVRHFPSTTVPRDTAITNWITAEFVSTVSTNDLANSNFELFPNPTDGSSTINFKTPAFRTINIFNSLGEEILNQTNFNSSTQINLDSKGIYYIRILEKNGSCRTQKLIVQ